MDLTIVAPDVPGETSDFLKRSGIDFERAERLSEARGDFALVSGGAEVTPALVEALWTNRDEAEAIVASRYVRGARGGSVPSRLLNGLFRRLLDLPCFDVTSSLRLYRASALRRARCGDAAAGPDALIHLVNAGFKIREVPWEGPVGPDRLGGHLAMLPRLRRLRHTPDAADADDRAFERAGRFRRKRLEKRQATIVSFLEVDVPVLDVGCGSSRLVQSLSKGVGLDRDPAKIRFLRGRARAAICGDIGQLPFRDGSFPQLVLADVPVERAHLTEVKRVLTPRGTLVLATPDASSWPELEARLSEEGFWVDEVRRARAERIVRAVLRQPPP